MSSQRRIDASRANGRRSRGPVTPEGKARSAANSLRHGLLAKICLLESESREMFDHLVDSFAARFQPADEVEWGLVEEMVSATWRLRRCWAVETRVLDQEIAAQFEGDQLDRIAAGLAKAAAGQTLPLMHRYETRLHRMYQRALHGLLRLRASFPVPDSQELPNEPNPISGQAPAAALPPESAPGPAPAAYTPNPARPVWELRSPDPQPLDLLSRPATQVGRNEAAPPQC
jgi:hypothetical protein